MSKRRMTSDIYGVRGWFKGGTVTDHLVAGSVVELGVNARGERCVFAYGREYPLDFSLEYDVMRRSEPLENVSSA